MIQVNAGYHPLGATGVVLRHGEGVFEWTLLLLVRSSCTWEDSTRREGQSTDRKGLEWEVRDAQNIEI